jgi:hypothetical protein
MTPAQVARLRAQIQLKIDTARRFAEEGVENAQDDLEEALEEMADLDDHEPDGEPE